MNNDKAPKRGFDDALLAAFFAGWNAGGALAVASRSSISPMAEDYIRKQAFQVWRVQFSGALDIAPVSDEV